MHIKEFIARPRRPVDGDVIVYEIGVDTENRPQAVNVRYRFDESPERTRDRSVPAKSIGFGGFLTVAFLGLLVILCVLKMISVWVLVLYLLLSFVTLLVYVEDKTAAQTNRWRTSENMLQALALFGGWPGAVLGQKMFRHKTRKREFQLVFWCMVFLNCGIFALSLTDVGAGFLRTLTESAKESAPDTRVNDPQLPRIRSRSNSSMGDRPESGGDEQQLPVVRPLPRSTERKTR